MTTDAWITLIVLVATFGVLAFDRLPTAAAMGAAVGVLLLAGLAVSLGIAAFNDTRLDEIEKLDLR